MIMISTVFLLLALICALLAAIGVGHAKVSVGWLGVFFYFFSLVVGRF